MTENVTLEEKFPISVKTDCDPKAKSLIELLRQFLEPKRDEELEKLFIEIGMYTPEQVAEKNKTSEILTKQIDVMADQPPAGARTFDAYPNGKSGMVGGGCSWQRMAQAWVIIILIGALGGCIGWLIAAEVIQVAVQVLLTKWSGLNDLAKAAIKLDSKVLWEATGKMWDNISYLRGVDANVKTIGSFVAPGAASSTSSSSINSIVMWICEKLRSKEELVSDALEEGGVYKSISDHMEAVYKSNSNPNDNSLKLIADGYKNVMWDKARQIGSQFETKPGLGKQMTREIPLWRKMVEAEIEFQKYSFNQLAEASGNATALKNALDESMLDSQGMRRRISNAVVSNSNDPSSPIPSAPNLPGAGQGQGQGQGRSASPSRNSNSYKSDGGRSRRRIRKRKSKRGGRSRMRKMRTKKRRMSKRRYRR